MQGIIHQQSGRSWNWRPPSWEQDASGWHVPHFNGLQGDIATHWNRNLPSDQCYWNDWDLRPPEMSPWQMQRILQVICYYYSWYILHILHVPKKSISRFQLLFQPVFEKKTYFEGIRSTIGIKLPHAWAHAHVKNRNASRSWHETNCPFNPMGKGPPETSPRSTRNSHSTQASHEFLRIVDLPLQVLIFNWSPVDHALDVVIDYAPLRMILGWEGWGYSTCQLKYNYSWK